MQKATVTVALTIFLLALSSSATPPAKHRILKQPSAPVQIVSYKAEYKPKSGRYTREGIYHYVTFENISERDIVALQFGLLSFNIFNEFQDRLSGFTIEPLAVGMSSSGSWRASASAESSFYTGVAYVSKIRFFNGEVWSANLADITKQVQEIEEGFSVESLAPTRR